jgi:hypothetical protein
MVGADSRDLAGQYMHDVAKAGSHDASVGLVADPWFWTPAVFPMAAGPRPAEAIFPAMNAATLPKVVMHSEKPDRFDWDTNLLLLDKPDYVAFTNYNELVPKHFADTGWKDNGGPLLASRYEVFIEHLSHGYRLDRSFGQTGTLFGEPPPDMMYTNMEVEIWKRKDLP